VKPLAIHPEADAEALAAAAYYEERRPGYGRRFLEELAAALDRIRRLPEASAAIDGQGARKHRLRRFPYTIFYNEFAEVIWIAPVAHQRRRPGYWAERRPPTP
jgi:toxin ParE1/3/4